MKIRLFVLMISMAFVLAGCGRMQEGDVQRASGEMYGVQFGTMSEDGSGQGETAQKVAVADMAEKTVLPEETEVTLKETIQDMERGLTAVKYEGDYGFEDFLSGGLS